MSHVVVAGGGFGGLYAARRLERRLPRFAWFPFGGGPRLCIGQSFAMMEARLVLATLAQHFRLERLSEAPVKLLPSITLRPRHGVPLRLRARQPPGRHSPQPYA